MISFVSLSLVHVIQSVQQWGKEPVVVIKERGVNTNKADKKAEEANDTKSAKVRKKRKSRKEANADRELIKKLKEDEKAVVARTNRQQNDLELLNTGIRFIN